MATKVKSKWVLLENDAKRIKQLKVNLEERGFYDKSRVIIRLEHSQYALPVLMDQLVASGNLTAIPNNDLPVHSAASCTDSALDFEGRRIIELDLSVNERYHGKERMTDSEALTAAVTGAISDLNISDKQALSIFTNQLKMTKIYRHGDLVVLSKGALTHSLWSVMEMQVPSLWTQLASALHCSRIAIQSRVAPDEFRSPNVELVLGETGWVEHVDNHVKYVFDVTSCMFSQGNISEKIRMASLSCLDETIVDLYAGIGYFTLPLLVHAGAACVHACDWNPTAIEGLRRGLLANGIQEDRCVIHYGDNRKVAPRGIADRVLLGLIPSSKEGWATACSCLKSDTGGWLHVHGNVSTHMDSTSISLTRNNEPSNVKATSTSCSCNSISLSSGCKQQQQQMLSLWADNVASSIKGLLDCINPCTAGRDWSVIVEHIEHVKSYAPHVDHIVTDIHCIPVD